jgi:predicted HD phosphohydrolase
MQGHNKALRRALHRVDQFFRATFAQVRPAEIDELRSILTPEQMALFQRMNRIDQRHSLDVMNTLRRAGHHDGDLMQAALLHDAGKSVAEGGLRPAARGPLQRLTVWHRTAVVLMQKNRPGWLARLAADGRGWKRPFADHVHHAAISAELASQAGSTTEVVAAIRSHHESDSGDQRAALLQWADEQN